MVCIKKVAFQEMTPSDNLPRVIRNTNMVNSAALWLLFLN